MIQTFMAYHWISNKSNTMGARCGVKTAHHSGASTCVHPPPPPPTRLVTRVTQWVLDVE